MQNDDDSKLGTKIRCNPGKQIENQQSFLFLNFRDFIFEKIKVSCTNFSATTLYGKIRKKDDPFARGLSLDRQRPLTELVHH